MKKLRLYVTRSKRRRRQNEHDGSKCNGYYLPNYSVYSMAREAQVVLGQLNIQGRDKVEAAIKRLQMFEPEEGYYLAFSGGKDSVCVKALADMAGVKYDAHYNITTVDPPELVAFVKSFKDVKMDRAYYKDGTVCTMWNLALGIRYEIPEKQALRKINSSSWVQEWDSYWDEPINLWINTRDMNRDMITGVDENESDS